MKLADLLATATIMLIGKESVDFSYYILDEKSWEQRLLMSIN